MAYMPISTCHEFIEYNKDNKKPLFRWTAGKDNNCHVILFESIKTFKKLYGDIADGVIVFNEDFTKNSFLCFQNYFKDLNINCIYGDSDALPFKPKNAAWKFYPPRLRLQSHEIFIDSDLVLLSKGKYIQDFLNSDHAFANISRLRKFGDYFEEIKEINPKQLRGMGINSGIFGFPPDYDIKPIIQKKYKGWDNHLNHQGLVASLVLDIKHVMIPPPYIYNYYNCHCSIITSFKCKFPNFIFREKRFTDIMEGFHFCNGNNNNLNPAWKYYSQNPFGKVNENTNELPDKMKSWASGELKGSNLI